MNYEKHYNQLMLKALKRQDDNPEWHKGMTIERHHWYPKSLYPEFKSADWNIVKLTSREHYIAHWLLFKMLPNCKKMFNAFYGMSAPVKLGARRQVNAKMYAKLKAMKSKAMLENPPKLPVPVICINNQKVFRSMLEASEYFGFSRHKVSQALRKEKRIPVYGLHFDYYEEGKQYTVPTEWKAGNRSKYKSPITLITGEVYTNFTAALIALKLTVPELEKLILIKSN